MRKFKHLLKKILPPALWDCLRLINKQDVCFEGSYQNWESASLKCSGYSKRNILEKVLDATLKVKNGEAIYERDSVVFDDIQYAWPVTAALMWAAAKNEGNLKVLDFGGSLGSSYFQNRKFLDSLKSVSWNVVEQTHYVDVGRQYIEDERLHFYKSIEELLEHDKPNVVLLSSVLQYLEFPYEVLNAISDVGAGVLIIDRTPFSSEASDEIVVQRVSPKIYYASYPMWIFSRSNFLDFVEKKWNIINQNIGLEGSIKINRNFEVTFEGFILELRSD